MPYYIDSAEAWEDLPFPEFDTEEEAKRALKKLPRPRVLYTEDNNEGPSSFRIILEED